MTGALDRASDSKNCFLTIISPSHSSYKGPSGLNHHLVNTFFGKFSNDLPEDMHASLIVMSVDQAVAGCGLRLSFFTNTVSRVALHNINRFNWFGVNSRATLNQTETKPTDHGFRRKENEKIFCSSQRSDSERLLCASLAGPEMNFNSLLSTTCFFSVAENSKHSHQLLSTEIHAHTKQSR